VLRAMLGLPPEPDEHAPPEPASLSPDDASMETGGATRPSLSHDQ